MREMGIMADLRAGWAVAVTSIMMPAVEFGWTNVGRFSAIAGMLLSVVMIRSHLLENKKRKLDIERAELDIKNIKKKEGGS